MEPPRLEVLQTVYIVRHGDRLDYALGEEGWKALAPERPFDPPLSDTGLAQAAETGKEIKRLSNDEKIHRVLVSPFYRCLQTANPIAAELDVPLCVEESLWEMAPGLIDVALPSASERAADFPRINLSYASTFRPEPNESYPHGSVARCHMIKSCLIEQFFPDENIVIVTHAANAVGITSALLQCPISDVRPAHAAGVYKLVRRKSDDKWVSVLESHVEHLAALPPSQTWPFPGPQSSNASQFIAAGDAIIRSKAEI
jgi:broad specificity phosphatase PhoE